MLTADGYEEPQPAGTSGRRGPSCDTAAASAASAARADSITGIK